MRWPRLAPRIAISLPLSWLFLAARLAGVDTLAAAAAAALIAAMVTPATTTLGIAGTALLAALGAAAWAGGAGGTAALLAALPLAGNLALAWHFGGTLRPGREPLITRHARVNHGTVPTALARYTRRLTLAWTVVFLGLAAVSAATLAGLGPPAGPAAVAALGLSLVLFLGEHALRSRLFPELGPARPARTLRVIWLTDIQRHAR